MEARRRGHGGDGGDPGWSETSVQAYIGPHTRNPTHLDSLSAAATYRAAGLLEAKAAAAFARSAEVLVEAHRLGLAIDDLLAPLPDDDEPH